MLTERASTPETTHSETQAEFLARLSHEMRNPLNGILGWTQILRRDGASEDDVANGLAMIDRGARTMVQLANDLLDVSRLLAGVTVLTRAPVDLREAVAAAMRSLSQVAKEKGVVVECALDGGLPKVEGDAVRLQQIMRNLLANAIKFSARGGRVEVRGERREGQAVLSVHDDGIGIAPDRLQHLFDFPRQRQDRARRLGGLGLGLALVKHLTELHGGRVVAESAGQDQGSTFEIWLPAEVNCGTPTGVNCGTPTGVKPEEPAGD